MKIIKATPNHLNQIMQVIDVARNIMRTNGNTTQWTNGYPSKEIISEDIRNNEAYVCVDNSKIVGYFAFKYGNNPEPTYNVINNGNWLNNNDYGVIHRLASNNKTKGIAKTCFDFCFTIINNIKVDTHKDNIPMKNFFNKYGFKYCGIIYVSDGTSREAYQKTLK